MPFNIAGLGVAAMDFFTLSKIFWLVCAPSHALAWLAIGTAVASAAGRIREARVLAVLAGTMFLALGILPGSTLALRPLEDRYPRPAWPTRLDGIVVLDGEIDIRTFVSRGVPVGLDSDTRLIGGFELARRYPNARVVYSGGSGTIERQPRPGTFAATYIFNQMGLDPSRLTLESKSRNTWENLLYSRRAADAKPGQVWALATSAYHMPRAMGVANRLGWRMLPWPTDYMTPRSGFTSLFDVPRNLEIADLAAHEWIGLAAYRLSGKTAPTPS